MPKTPEWGEEHASSFGGEKCIDQNTIIMNSGTQIANVIQNAIHPLAPSAQDRSMAIITVDQTLSSA